MRLMIDFVEMVNMNLFSGQQKVGGGHLSSATLALALPTTTPSLLKVQEIPLDEATRKTSEVSGEGSKSRASKGKKPAAPAEEASAPRAKPKSVKELCSARPGEDGREYHVIRVSNQSERDPNAPMVVNLFILKHDYKKSPRFEMGLIRTGQVNHFKVIRDAHTMLGSSSAQREENRRGRPKL
ncbi:hypothetical protein B296_00034262 [Ensete ventricosum]|uniref:Uncharacterized protein n=1 Tax=Ensete ventricosum TaxID=4639 RepID=A0A426XEG6_ENSVE|nr:hypothetical protein B296_00034262 [Ensete ventricosum]